METEVTENPVEQEVLVAIEQEMEVSEPQEPEIEITESNWEEETGFTAETLSGAIETLIFMSDRPISLAKIRKMTDERLPLKIIHKSIAQLQEGYELAQHGIRIQEVAEGYQFRTKATYSKYVHDLLKISALTLTPATQEVLAVIAYKQPVSKTEIEKIRGVDSSHLIRGLLDKRLIKIVGRSEEMGRPSLYATTSEFLEVFNLASLEDLPPEYELEELATKNTVGEISDIREIIANSKAQYEEDELEELDKLGEEIKLIAADTEFTKSLKMAGKKVEGEQAKSAFELLEEYLGREEISKQNELAAESENLMSIENEGQGVDAPPEVNQETAPDLLNDQEEGEPPVEVAPPKPVNLDEGYVENSNQQDLHNDEQALSAALDKVFENMTKDSSAFEESEAQFDEGMELLEQELEQKLEAMDGQLVEILEQVQDPSESEVAKDTDPA